MNRRTFLSTTIGAFLAVALGRKPVAAAKPMLIGVDTAIPGSERTAWLVLESTPNGNPGHFYQLYQAEFIQPYQRHYFPRE